MKISFLLIVCLVAPTTVSRAQQIHVGLRAGINIANFSGSADTKFGPRTAFTAGVYFRTELSPILLFAPEIGYSIKGATTDDVILEGVPTGLKATFSLPYVDVSAPLLLQPTKIGKFEPYIFAGPALGYRLDARIELIDRDSGASVIENDDSIVKYDFGAIGGIGAYYNLGSQKLSAEIRYFGGFTDVRDRPDAPLRNSTVGFLVGVSL